MHTGHLLADFETNTQWHLVDMQPIV